MKVEGKSHFLKYEKSETQPPVFFSMSFPNLAEKFSTPPPSFIPCPHRKDERPCTCLSSSLKEKYIYRFHSKPCWKQIENLGHKNFVQGYYRVEKPVWRHECYCEHDVKTQEHILQFFKMFDLKCLCTSSFTCVTCTSINCDPNNFKAELYVDSGVSLDLDTCLALVPFLKGSWPTDPSS